MRPHCVPISCANVDDLTSSDHETAASRADSHCIELHVKRNSIEAGRGGLISQARALVEDAQILADQHATVLARLAEVVAEIDAVDQACEKPALVEPRLLSLAQAAIALGVSKSTVQRLIRDGDLRTVPVRGLPRIPMAAIDAFAASGVRRAA